MNFEFGNIHHVSPDQMLLDASFQNVLKEIEQGVAVCRKSCPWFRWCGGGAPANKYFEHGSFAVGSTMFCELTKSVLLDTVLAAIEDGLSHSLVRGVE